MNARWVRWVRVCLLVALCASCRSYDLRFDPADPRPSAAVLAVWNGHRDVLVRVLKEKKFTIREFTESVEFFEGLTCMRSRQTRAYMGLVPNGHLDKDLARWDRWLRSYAADLEPAPDAEGLSGGPSCTIES